jgi:hypothetical protein
MTSLDEDHRLRISIGGHAGSWPISTIKFAQKLGQALRQILVDERSAARADHSFLNGTNRRQDS